MDLFLLVLSLLAGFVTAFAGQMVMLLLSKARGPATFGFILGVITTLIILSSIPVFLDQSRAGAWMVLGIIFIVNISLKYLEIQAKQASSK